MSKFEVSANGHVFGVYEAGDAQTARDLCAEDAGYRSEAQMVGTLEQPSELVARPVDVILISAGEETWGADRDVLAAALRRLHWKRCSGPQEAEESWLEPESDPDDEGQQYTLLCSTVPALAGYGADDSFDESDLAEFRCSPENPRRWDLFRAPC